MKSIDKFIEALVKDTLSNKITWEEIHKPYVNYNTYYGAEDRLRNTLNFELQITSNKKCILHIGLKRGRSKRVESRKLLTIYDKIQRDQLKQDEKEIDDFICQYTKCVHEKEVK